MTCTCISETDENGRCLDCGEPLEPQYQTRVLSERDELDQKMTRLLEFMGLSEFDNLETEEQFRLRLQYSIMIQYRAVLDQRIAYFNRTNK